MGIYAAFDGEISDQIASNQGWADFGRWSDKLDAGKFPEIVLLSDYGWSQHIPLLRDQLKAAASEVAPDANTVSIITGLVDLLTGSQSEVVTVTNGITPGKSLPVAESIHESVASHPINARLRTHAKARQEEAQRQADAAANAIGSTFDRLVQELADLSGKPDAASQVVLILRRLVEIVGEPLADRLQKIAKWSYTHTADNLMQSVPTKHLESLLPTIQESRVLEDIGTTKRPGLAAFGIDPAGELVTQDLLAKLRDNPDLSDDERRDLFQQLLFPAPTADQIAAAVNRGGVDGTWLEQLTRATSLTNPMELGEVLTTGYAAGKTRAELVQDLMQIMDGPRSAAERVARTESLRIAHSLNMAANDEIDDLIMGYQIHATPGPNSRSWHQKRSGTIYYKEPGSGQKGLAQMPSPPEEAPDPSERPAGTPSTAYNCLCFLSVVLNS